MRPRLHMFAWLGLALVCCNKPERRDARAGEHDAPPRITKTPRPDVPGRSDELRASLKTAGNIPSPEEREKAIAGVAWNALELDPDLAREAFQQLATDSAEKIRLLREFAVRRADQNVDDALAWAAGVGSDKEIAAAKGQIALVLAGTDPERAANLLSESGIAGREFEIAVVQVLRQWADKSPSDAAAWVVMFPAGKAREAGIKAVVSQWADANSEAAFSWIASLQDEAVHKEAARAAAEILMEQPQDVRKAWLQHADPRIRSGLEQQEKEAGRNDPPP